MAVLSIAITVSGLYVALILNAYLGTAPASGRYNEAQVESLRHVLGTWTVFLLILAAVNAFVITWATVLDSRRSSALARALGATPVQRGAGQAAGRTEA